MANILTAAEAANVLRCSEDDPLMLDLLPAIDKQIRRATGHDWSADNPVLDEAKSAARMLLAMWHGDPAQIGSPSSLPIGYTSATATLEALALRYRRFTGRNGAGAILISGAHAGDTVEEVIGLIGVTGDQATAFEGVITVDGQIQQVSTADLSANWYRAYLVPLGER